MQYEEGVWHAGAVALMSSKPRLWLREAVAQHANVIFLVGFEKEDELYNEKSFRSMLSAFDEYEATDELEIMNIVKAKEQYYKQSLGIDPKVEQVYQSQKATLEEKIADVEKQLKEIDAMY
jgi:predicted patatin/cPLA2 family phospholipase